MSRELTPVMAGRLDDLAREIYHQEAGLDYEDRQAEGVEHRTYARCKRDRNLARARVMGMRVALSYALGKPMDLRVVEAYVDAVHQADRAVH